MSARDGFIDAVWTCRQSHCILQAMAVGDTPAGPCYHAGETGADRVPVSGLVLEKNNNPPIHSTCTCTLVNSRM
jgi:hypothetical protein